jgi:peptide/nickel transport system ATP-binding protein
MYAGKVAEKATVSEIVDHPQHPYTKLLIGSLPEVGVRFAEHRLSGIEGRPPSLLQPPPGCRFRDRCPLATERCKAEPPLRRIDGHDVACWEVGE